MALDLNGETLPFLFDMERNDHGTWLLIIRNGEESIAVDDIDVRGDSIWVRMPLYDSEFIGVFRTDSLWVGNWHNYLKGPAYTIPFVARAGIDTRFRAQPPTIPSLTGQWEVHFAPGTKDAFAAIGSFQQEEGGRTTGTFITETGDFRYLEGVVSNDTLFLSCFDGSHAFLFKASNRGDSLHGVFLNGSHWKSDWLAVRNPTYSLSDPDSLTFLREGYNMVDFSFPDLDGRSVSPKDSQFQGKTLLVQIMGSWCPNCVDETRLLNELYAKHRMDGLEVISVAFEKYEDPARSIAALRRFRDALDVSFPILYGGRSDKASAAEKLPFLNHLISYPTCIIIDRNGVVRRIRTGIYGPGTGDHYIAYKRSLEGFLKTLLAEGDRANR